MVAEIFLGLWYEIWGPCFDILLGLALNFCREATNIRGFFHSSGPELQEFYCVGSCATAFCYRPFLDHVIWYRIQPDPIFVVNNQIHLASTRAMVMVAAAICEFFGDPWWSWSSAADRSTNLRHHGGSRTGPLPQLSSRDDPQNPVLMVGR